MNDASDDPVRRAVDRIIRDLAEDIAKTYKIDSAHSFIRFNVRHLLGTARGEFHKFSGTIEYDSKQPDASGKFQINCAQLCGNGHSRMSGGFLYVDSPEDYQKWLDSKAGSTGQKSFE